GLVRLPESEVAWVLLARVRLLLLHLVRTLSRQASVFRERRDAEVDVAVRLVRVTTLYQVRDEADDLWHDFARLRERVGAAEPELIRVLEVPLRCARGE